MKKSRRLKSCASILTKKVRLIMKLTVILLVAFQMSVYASAFSQTKVSLNLKDATIEEFISMMKVQTEQWKI